MDKIKNYIKNNSKELFAICGIFIFALMLRMMALINFGEMGLDELYTWYFSTQKTLLGTIKGVIVHDVHTPLYFIILHIWTKIVGVSPKAMRLCSLGLSITAIPFAFYLAKKHFNAMTGYFASIMLAISTFCVFYSVQIRFYSLIIPLTLILGFLFLELLDEEFKKKSAVLFILVHTLLVYTFTLSLVLSFFYAFIGFIYLLIKKRNIKEFILTYLVSGIFAAPAIAFVIYNIMVMRNNFCLHTIDFFTFKWFAVYDIIENFFSSENYQIVMRSVATYRNFFDNIASPKYLILVGIPIIICLVAIVRALFSKNKKIYMLFIPSVLTILTLLLFSSAGILYYQTKYLMIVYPLIVCCCAFGFSAFNNKKAAMLVFALFVYLNSMYIIFIPYNIYSYGAKEVAGNLAEVAQKQIAIQEDDIVFTPFISDKFEKVINTGRTIYFPMDEALLLKNKKPLIYYFGEEKLAKLNRKNIKDEIVPDLVTDKVEPVYEKNLYDDYIKNMKPFQRFIIIVPYEHVTGRMDQPITITKDNYKNKTNFEVIMTKATRDTVLTVEKHLRYMGYYYDQERGYRIYIFEKS